MDERNTSKLVITTPTEKEIVLRRTLNAPRDLVWSAWTKPEHVRRWWTGCDEMTLTVCDIDLRVGGAWRYVLRAPNGEEYGFGGVYREIVPPARLVYSFVYDPFPDSPALNTVRFDEHDGRTTVTETVLHLTQQARDGHLQSGLETGAAASYDRLDALLGTLK